MRWPDPTGKRAARRLPSTRVRRKGRQADRGGGRHGRRSDTGRVHAARRLGGALISTLLLAAVLVAATPEPASAGFAFTERANYGRNEAIVVDVGGIEFIEECRPAGKRDYIYPWADLYVIPGTTQPAFGSFLQDVAEAPNAVYGSSGGGFFGEVIGYTKPAGEIGPGVYSIVIDECQDKRFDADDAFMAGAFEVTSETTVRSIPNIQELKDREPTTPTLYSNLHDRWVALKWMLEVYEVVSIVLSPATAGIDLVFYAAGKLAGTIFPDPKDVLITHLGNQQRRHEGLAKDPPDPNFQQTTPLAGTEPLEPVGPSPVEQAALAAGSASIPDEAVLTSLVTSLERYQGAAQVGNGDWALVHARQTQEYARLLAGRLAGTTAAYEAWADAPEASPVPFQRTAGDLMGPIAEDFVANGPTSEQEAALASHGVGEAEVAGLFETWADLDLASFDTAEAVGLIRDLAASDATFSAELLQLADDLDTNIAELTADPYVSDSWPTADAGGPYAGTEGSAIAFDGSASTGSSPITTYEWDLDGDGDFDDAAGAAPVATAGEARDSVVGLRVTAENGRRDIAYAPISLAEDDGGPQITGWSPDPAATSVDAGEVAGFSVGATDPEGLPLDIRWDVPTGPRSARGPSWSTRRRSTTRGCTSSRRRSPTRATPRVASRGSSSSSNPTPTVTATGPTSTATTPTPTSTPAPSTSSTASTTTATPPRPTAARTRSSMRARP
ncbi:MAG: hypothetical protein U5R31_15050 [Acidimicrobiia bacterium]|nr:hypothetical protein [Acidimicrobiia bacterium]